MKYVIQKKQQQFRGYSWKISYQIKIGIYILILTSMAIGFPSFAKSREPATVRFAKGENVDLSLIIQEWRSKHPDIPIFVCNCKRDICDTNPYWPFRQFRKYQFHVALGSFNANEMQAKGFKCFDIETGAPPEQLDMPN
jgi:hypothetical protein